MLRFTYVVALMAVGLLTFANHADATLVGATTQAASCRGSTATITGTPGENLTGTPGDDVIVTNGAARVDALEGNDVICTTNTPPTSPADASAVTIFAGPGNDVIDRTGDLDPAASSLTSLDSGEDSYFGGVASDSVNATDADADIIQTGAGGDSVLSGSSDGPGSTGADQISLGEGDDTFSLYGSDIAAGLAVSGDTGLDLLEMQVTGAGRWVLDAAHDGARFKGVHAFGFDGMESFQFASRSSKAAFRFYGTAANEDVSVSPSSVADGADLGAGDDQLALVGVFSPNKDPRATSPFNGGTGTDTITVQAFGENIRLSLVGQRLDYRFTNTGAPDNDLRGFENAVVFAGDARITGDAGANTINWHGCPGRVQGGKGDDTLRWLADSFDSCDENDPRIRMYGNAGDDLLFGGRFDDVLLGGPGRDTADGLAGQDLCRAEVRVKCESE